MQPQGDQMPNSLLPLEERHLTPDQVEALDKRRDLGHTFLVIAGQFAVIATVLLLWVGQDLTYSPGWAHPMAYYFVIACGIILVMGIAGLILRRGTPRID
jgi:nitrate reductase gamma subunit